MARRLYDDVRWGEERCYPCGCIKFVDVFVDGRALCLDCADLDLERFAANAIHHPVAGLLPPLFEGR